MIRISIELPTWLGDAVMTTPAIENLLNFYNDSEITLIGSLASVETLKRHSKVKNVFIFEKKYLNLFKKVRSLGEFDLFFSFRSAPRSKILKYLINSKKKYQFDKNKFNTGHQVEKYNQFINDCLGINSSAKNLKVDLVVKNKFKNKKLLGINPGSTYGNSKRWYPEEFAKVAIQLSSQYDIIIFGGKAERDIAEDIEKHLIENGISNYQNLAAKTTIIELINKVSSLDLFITGDSGPMHLAAAFQIPSVAIFGPTNNNVTSQWRNDNGTIVKKNLDCQPCMKRICPLKHHKCMKEISAEEVLDAAKKLLRH